MKIGVPTEIMNHEWRIGFTPTSVLELTRRGREVFCQSDAGLGIGLDDETFAAAGARIVPDAAAVFADPDLSIPHIPGVMALAEAA